MRVKKEYLDFFNATVSKVKRVVNITVPIIPFDHDEIKGHKNALGICHGTRYADGSGWEAEKITIDEYFIEECYKAEVEGFPYMLDLIGDNLIGVICHEIAHTRILRHGKKHRELTQMLISIVESGEPHVIESISA